ncbi:hypothetical protein ABMA32_03205 [Mesorhizobium sp. VNQ89]|uniref:hypothetical protein n=1 Tax=Mesorhizobium quangtriensis TaxID=3157709 RepID=UPI0032B78620
MARKPETPSKPDTEKAAGKSPSPSETQELRERIERLEERLDESILGDDGLAELDHGIDKTQSADPLRKAVQRSNVKRGSRKA